MGLKRHLSGGLTPLSHLNAGASSARMVASHITLMHRANEWFFRQPPRAKQRRDPRRQLPHRSLSLVAQPDLLDVGQRPHVVVQRLLGQHLLEAIAEGGVDDLEELAAHLGLVAVPHRVDE